MTSQQLIEKLDNTDCNNHEQVKDAFKAIGEFLTERDASKSSPSVYTRGYK
jgi:hypothetical protein